MTVIEIIVISVLSIGVFVLLYSLARVVNEQGPLIKSLGVSNTGLGLILSELVPLVEVLYEKDIELVVRTDHPEYEFSMTSLGNSDIKIHLKSLEKSDQGSWGMSYSYIERTLRDVRIRAAELRDLKAKLCPTKCSKKAK